MLLQPHQIKKKPFKDTNIIKLRGKVKFTHVKQVTVSNYPLVHIVIHAHTDHMNVRRTARNKKNRNDTWDRNQQKHSLPCVHMILRAKKIIQPF